MQSDILQAFLQLRFPPLNDYSLCQVYMKLFSINFIVCGGERIPAMLDIRDTDQTGGWVGSLEIGVRMRR